MSSPDQVALLAGTIDGLRALRSLDYVLVVASNQSGVGRGMFGPEEADAVHARMVSLLGEHGVWLDGAYYCLHGPDEGCDCRKPGPGLFRRAAEELSIDMASSLTIGDRRRDLLAGHRAGCLTTILLGDGDAGQGEDEAVRAEGSDGVPSFRAGSWPELITWVEVQHQ